MLQTFKQADRQSLARIAEEQKLRGTKELFLLFSLGSQFDHLIKQRLDSMGVFCLVADPAVVTATDVASLRPTGIILSGGPASAYDNPPFDEKILELGIPTLGICLGYQLWARHLGVTVAGSERREFGSHVFSLLKNNALLAGWPPSSMVLESHGDRIEPQAPLEILGTTEHAPAAAAKAGHLWGVQFHPEVSETEHGDLLLENFCFAICGARDRYPAAAAAEKKISQLSEKIGEGKVLLAISGGTDSAVVAYLLKRAVQKKPGKIQGVYIKGVDRPDDEANVIKYFSRQSWMRLKIVDAAEEFLQQLRGKAAMPEKRHAIRSVYKNILQKEAADFAANFVAQGTLYTDISESGGGYDTGSQKAQIKLHHNVNLGFDLPELTPLADCVKDTARQIGKSIGVPEDLLFRHPFPGPGLAVRIEGEITAEKLRIARAADGIFLEELRRWNLYQKTWQAGAVVTSSQASCTKGDDAASGHVLALWAVWSVNGFTAKFAELPYEFLKQVSRRLTNEVRQIGAVVYRISDKPPATIEWG